MANSRRSTSSMRMGSVGGDSVACTRVLYSRGGRPGWPLTSVQSCIHSFLKRSVSVFSTMALISGVGKFRRSPRTMSCVEGPPFTRSAPSAKRICKSKAKASPSMGSFMAKETPRASAGDRSSSTASCMRGWRLTSFISIGSAFSLLFRLSTTFLTDWSPAPSTNCLLAARSVLRTSRASWASKTRPKRQRSRTLVRASSISWSRSAWTFRTTSELGEIGLEGRLPLPSLVSVPFVVVLRRSFRSFRPGSFRLASLRSERDFEDGELAITVSALASFWAASRQSP
mmetsp:Transcript_76335/g.196564  ORF Transcript_76335/g.196564 Transcript_76335/m.196564 type:complete len:285 (-) Transcript_76335:121-975(-)